MRRGGVFWELEEFLLGVKGVKEVKGVKRTTVINPCGYRE